MADTGYRIVVGVDGSDAGVRALRWAVREASARGGTVHAVAVWSWQGLDALPASPQTARDAAEQLLGEAVAQVVQDAPRAVVVPRAVLGQPADALVDYARDADLLVLGSHGHGRLFHAVLGSVADQCVRTAHCPVVVVPVPQPAPTGTRGAVPV